MAALNLVACNSADVTLTAPTAKTVLQIIAPTNQRLRVTRWGIGFDGTTAANEPITVSLQRQTTAGTVTALTPKRRDPTWAYTGVETIQSTASENATVEPTSGEELSNDLLHPQTGGWRFDVDIIVNGGGRLAIKCTAPNNVNCRAWIEYEE